MPSNEEAIALLRRIADLLEIQGERFKPEAYRRAARSIEGLGDDLAAVARRGGLDQIPGVGEAIGEKLRGYLKDGRIAYLERLQQEVPPGLVELLGVPGLGPKTVRRFWTELGILGPAELRAAIDAGRLDGLRGFGPTKIHQIATALSAGRPSGRIDLWSATEIADRLTEGLRASAPIDQLSVAGSYRRARETVGDLDLLATSAQPEAVFDAFERLPDVASVQLRGGTKETVNLRSGLQVDLRVVAPEAFGAALQYFTGSKDHNVALRTRARDLGLKVNEYGVFRGEERVAGATERSVYEALGLPEIPPELRENRGEIEAAEAGRLPTLVAPGDVVGELHVHPPEPLPEGWPDGLRAAARAAGLAYVGVVLPAALAAPELERWRTRLAGPPGTPRLLLGLETSTPTRTAPLPPVDFHLLAPATASPPDAAPEAAAPLAAVHLARALGGSGPELDPARFAPWARWAAELGVALELTASGAREGLDSGAARVLLERGGTLLISGGAEGTVQRRRLEVAVALARRAGAGTAQVLNTRPAPLGAAKGPRPARSRRPSRTDR